MKIEVNENGYWLGFWFIMLTAFLGTIGYGTSYWKDYNTKMVTMIVENGVDPIAANCAMQDDYGDNPSCIIIANKAK